MQKIFIVGNGPSAIAKKIGAEIDQSDIVIRINDFKTTGYEQFVGTKTDILFTCRLNEYLNTLHTFPEVVLCLLMNPLDGVTIPEKLLTSKNIVKNITWDEIKPLIKLFEFKNNTYPSTGLLCLLYAINRFGPVHITGFDNFSKGNAHYYQIEGRPFPFRHDGSRERNIINAMIDLGTIICMNDTFRYQEYDGHDCYLGE
jgi:hypothetical protein